MRRSAAFAAAWVVFGAAACRAPGPRQADDDSGSGQGGGELASDEALAALREKLAGGGES